MRPPFLPLLGFMASIVFGQSLEAADRLESRLHNFKMETVAEGLKNIWGLVKLPDGRFLLTEREGRIRVIENGKLLPEPLTGVPEVKSAGQAGMLDIELHPDYASNGWIYLAYSKSGAGGQLTSIIRFRLKGNELADVETVFDPPAEDYRTTWHHFGCRMEFDESRHLYFSIGDRGDPTTPANQAQKLTTVSGKIHRLHDDGRVPEDNPFVDTPGARPSIWSFGNRNSQGLRFQPGTGVLFETEHGPMGGDELNIIKKGANYGWPLVTFGQNYNSTPITTKTHEDGMEDPVTYWTPSIAVSGIDFYTGDLFPKWKNNLIVGSLAHQKLIRLEITDGKVTDQEILFKGLGRIRDIRCFDDGGIHVIFDDRIVRLVPAD